MESRALRLVSTGKEEVVFNGLADWLYEGKRKPHAPLGNWVCGAVGQGVYVRLKIHDYWTVYFAYFYFRS